jgi:hypothetical protein
LRFLISREGSDLRFRIVSDVGFFIFRKGYCSEPWAWEREDTVNTERDITIELASDTLHLPFCEVRKKVKWGLKNMK